MGNKNHTLCYRLGDISYSVIKPLAKLEKKNAIQVISIEEDDPDTFLVTLQLGILDNNVKRYVRSNDGYITLQVGNMDSGRSRNAGYYSNSTRKENRYSDKNIKRFPSRCFSSNYEIDIDWTENLNQPNVVELYIPKIAFTRNICPGYADFKRAKDSAAKAIREWQYIVYKVRFRYVWSSGDGSESPYIINSDEIEVYCEYTPFNRGETKIYEDSNIIIESPGYYPFVYDSDEDKYISTAHKYGRYNGTSFMIITPKNNNAISFDYITNNSREFSIERGCYDEWDINHENLVWSECVNTDSNQNTNFSSLDYDDNTGVPVKISFKARLESNVSNSYVAISNIQVY